MTEKGRRLRLSQLLVLLAMVTVSGQFFGLYRPTGPPPPSWFPQADKVEHALGFATPVFLICAARLRQLAERAVVERPDSARLSRRFQATVLAFFIAQAVVSEVIQHFFYRHRTGDPFDTLADIVGIALGLLVTWLVIRHQRTSGSSLPVKEAGRVAP
jgi:hypothetical protein